MYCIVILTHFVHSRYSAATHERILVAEALPLDATPKMLHRLSICATSSASVAVDRYRMSCAQCTLHDRAQGIMKAHKEERVT